MSRSKPRLLAVDDEKDMLDTFQTILGKNHQILRSLSGEDALDILKAESIDLVLLDIRMPKMDGIETLKKIKARHPDTEVVMVTASREIKSAVECIKLGAYDYVTKPFERDELKSIIEKALEKKALLMENLCLRTIIRESDSYCELIGKSDKMKKVFKLVDEVAKTESTVLITGESGTGKELVAKAIHKKGERVNKPFVAVNCAAIPDTLLESELFGFESGTFTGACERKLGKFELADGGTILLDEIGCMSPAMQAKLLRVLEDKKIDRIGGRAPIHVDVRIISATNIDFKSALRDGKFREDLYYRLNVIPLQIPSLKERKEDIPLLIEHFLLKFNKELNKNVKGFSDDAMRHIVSHAWPGNVRELQNMVERVVALSKNGTIRSKDLPIIEDRRNLSEPLKTIKLLSHAIRDFESGHLRRILDEMSWNQTKAAKVLGIHRTTLVSKIRNLGLKK